MPIDMKSFSSEGDKRAPTPSNRWWTLEDGEMPSAIQAVVTTLQQADSRRQAQMATSARLYGNVSLMGVNGLSLSRTQATQSPTKERISYNLVQSGIDTVTAKMIKNKPKPMCVTSGGDWKLKRRAEKLTKFIDGIFYENKAYDQGKMTFRDCGVIGDGMTHVFSRDNRVKFERVLAGELLVDQMEAFYGNPRQMHRVKNVDRGELAALFPEHKEQIMGAEPANVEINGPVTTVADQVTVVESWHLRSSQESTDGLRIVSINNGVLEREEWKRDYFPFAHLPWNPRMYGYWSQSGAEQIQNIQLEINKLLWVIQRAMHMAGTFKILAERGSKVVKEHFTNDFGVMLEYTGVEPKYIVPPIVSPEIYAHLRTLKDDGFAQLGVSQLSAASVKPSGLDSKVALREYQDIESERFQVLGQNYENYYLELANMAIDEVKEIFAQEKKYKVKLPGKKFLETIDWKDVKMSEDEYINKMFPISSLPSDPAGRLQTIQEYIQAGMLSPRAGKRLLDFPDLESAEQMDNAPEDWLHEVLERIIDDGEWYQPEPEDDLVLAQELTLKYIAYAKTLKVDEDRIQMLRDFLGQVTQMNNAAQAAQPSAGVPQAGPQPAPTSELVPNAPGLQAVA